MVLGADQEDFTHLDPNVVERNVKMGPQVDESQPEAMSRGFLFK